MGSPHDSSTTWPTDIQRHVYKLMKTAETIAIQAVRPAVASCEDAPDVFVFELVPFFEADDELELLLETAPVPVELEAPA